MSIYNMVSAIIGGAGEGEKGTVVGNGDPTGQTVTYTNSHTKKPDFFIVFADLDDIGSSDVQYVGFVMTGNNIPLDTSGPFAANSSLMIFQPLGGSATIQAVPNTNLAPFITTSNATIPVALANGVTYTWYASWLDSTGGGGGGSSAVLTTKTITANGTYNATDDSADGYSQVTVNVSSSGKNVQGYHGMDYTQSTTMTATDVTLTVAKTGTYKVSWMGYRNTNSSSGSQLYINGTAYGSANTTFTRTYGQSVILNSVSLTKDDVLVVRAQARSSTYFMYVGNLIIEEQ